MIMLLQIFRHRLHVIADCIRHVEKNIPKPTLVQQFPPAFKLSRKADLKFIYFSILKNDGINFEKTVETSKKNPLVDSDDSFISNSFFVMQKFISLFASLSGLLDLIKKLKAIHSKADKTSNICKCWSIEFCTCSPAGVLSTGITILYVSDAITSIAVMNKPTALGFFSFMKKLLQLGNDGPFHAAACIRFIIAIPNEICRNLCWSSRNGSRNRFYDKFVLSL
ncbi:hypothetical protein CDAR_426331 [Caerostris darwini]|uniref:Uncharacterized protein n=1 Tax=Caerostris darwini TaxID=1538125 RepID=A0AAV4VS01_9ARAC|nr:hypothetical protein CDAR_426331 [Caerostris darwini]